MQTVTLSTKNQIALPKSFLQLLGVKSGDMLLVDFEDKEINKVCYPVIKIKPIGKSVVSSLAGSIKVAKSKQGVPFTKVLSITKKKIAKKLAIA